MFLIIFVKILIDLQIKKQHKILKKGDGMTYLNNRFLYTRLTTVYNTTAILIRLKSESI